MLTRSQAKSSADYSCNSLEMDKFANLPPATQTGISSSSFVDTASVCRSGCLWGQSGEHSWGQSGEQSNRNTTPSPEWSSADTIPGGYPDTATKRASIILKKGQLNY